METQNTETQASFIGLDLSPTGIEQAHQNAMNQDSRLKFIVANMNKLELPKGSFNVAIAIDTLYYLHDTDSTLKQTLELLKPDGRMALFFSQWVMDDSEAHKLAADNTDLAQLLHSNSLSYQAIDLTKQGHAHWQKKLDTLESMQANFEAEGHDWLYKFRHREAHRYANWDTALSTRYLYIVER